MPHQDLKLREGHCGGIEVRTVGWQVEELGAALDNGLPDPSDLMRGQIIENDDITGPKRWTKDTLNVDPKGIIIHGAVEHPWRRQL